MCPSSPPKAGIKATNERLNEGVPSGASSPSRHPAVTCMMCGGINFRHEPDCSAAPKSARQNDSERLGYDAVNLPDHYKAFPMEPVRFCQENNLSFLQSSILKYVVRYNLKNGIEDLKKAARCLDMMMAFEEGDPDWWKLPGERATRRTYII